MASLPEVPVLTNSKTNVEVFSLFFSFTVFLVSSNSWLEPRFLFAIPDRLHEVVFLFKENFKIVFCLRFPSCKHLDGHPVEMGRAEGKRQLGTVMV